jgi:hypothetical protein
MQGLLFSFEQSGELSDLLAGHACLYPRGDLPKLVSDFAALLEKVLWVPVWYKPRQSSRKLLEATRDRTG